MFRDRILDYYYDIRDFIGRHKAVVMPLFLLLCVILTAGLAFGLRRNARSSTDTASEQTTAVPASEVPLEKNAVPEVNDLINRYYAAVADGDADAIEAMSSELSEEEKIRIRELAGYIDSYTQIDVYTKEGPVDQSWIAYVYTRLKLIDHEQNIPGLQTVYICTREDGSLYINNEETQPASVSDYIQAASTADDVVDLNNETAAEYNELIDSDAELSDYLDQIASTIDISVGQQLAALEQNRTTENADSSYLVANTDNINIRKSASADGTKIGTANTGDRFQLVDQLDDGWSEIIFNGQQAYVKSEFFTVEKAQDSPESTGSSSDSQTQE